MIEIFENIENFSDYLEMELYENIYEKFKLMENIQKMNLMHNIEFIYEKLDINYYPNILSDDIIDLLENIFKVDKKDKQISDWDGGLSALQSARKNGAPAHGKGVPLKF